MAMESNTKKINKAAQIPPASKKIPTVVFTIEVAMGFNTTLPLRILAAEYPPHDLHFKQTEYLSDRIEF
jgi:hypothetical protein